MRDSVVSIESSLVMPFTPVQCEARFAANERARPTEQAAMQRYNFPAVSTTGSFNPRVVPFYRELRGAFPNFFRRYP